MSRQVPVRNLHVGQVISLPDSDQGDPAVIAAASEPVGGARFLHLSDLYDGEPTGNRLCLGLDRLVLVHEITGWHHSYCNVSGRAVEVTYGRRTETVPPGATVHYTGAANPAVFPEGVFTHEMRPVQVEQETWPA